jgi:hypothetical protein
MRQKPQRARIRKSKKAKGRKARQAKRQKHAISPRTLDFTSAKVRLVTFAEAMHEPSLSSQAKELAAVPFDSVAEFVKKRAAKRPKGRPVNVEKIKEIATLYVSGQSKNRIAPIVFPNAKNPSNQLRTYWKLRKTDLEAAISALKKS